MTFLSGELVIVTNCICKVIFPTLAMQQFSATSWCSAGRTAAEVNPERTFNGANERAAEAVMPDMIFLLSPTSLSPVRDERGRVTVSLHCTPGLQP